MENIMGRVLEPDQVFAGRINQLQVIALSELGRGISYSAFGREAQRSTQRGEVCYNNGITPKSYRYTGQLGDIKYLSTQWKFNH